MNLPKRKPNRLKEYDYSQNAAYFITICTHNRINLFWNVGASNARPFAELTSIGKIVREAVLQIPMHYKHISLDHFAIMPNHIHLLLLVQNDFGRALLAPTLTPSDNRQGILAPKNPTISTVIQQFKGFVTKHSKQRIWQKSFHDHIIRNQADYQTVWTYIENNPLQWKDDCFYIEL